MNTPAAPLLDARAPADVEAEVRRRLGWPQEERDTLRAALIAVFGHYAGLIGRELNAAPGRHLDAFLDLLRPVRFPATPAGTLLAFRAVARPAGVAGNRTGRSRSRKASRCRPGAALSSRPMSPA